MSGVGCELEAREKKGGGVGIGFAVNSLAANVAPKSNLSKTI